MPPENVSTFEARRSHSPTIRITCSIRGATDSRGMP